RAGAAVEPVLRLVLRDRVALVVGIDVAVVSLGIILRRGLDRSVRLLLRVREDQEAVRPGERFGGRRRRVGADVLGVSAAAARAGEERGAGEGEDRGGPEGRA